MNGHGVNGRGVYGRGVYGRGVNGHRVPAWWPYAAELPDWDVWRDICGLVYAQLRDTDPAVLVRGEDAVDLRDAIRREEFLRSCSWMG